MSVIQEAQKIAAVVLFRDLHANKMDVYDVLAVFIREIINDRGLSTFSGGEMCDYLVKDYGFDAIPQNVIRICIKRTELVEQRNGIFTVIRKNLKDVKKDFGSCFEEEIAKNEEIIDEACKYCEDKIGKKLSKREKEDFTKSFCSFLLNDHADLYGAEISGFILSLGEEAQKRIDEITEGVMQYAALTYNYDISKIDKLKNEMTIFLDTEALLSFGGFHGEVFKRYIDEMLQLISEINEKTRKKYISVKYMDYVKKEIDDIFNSAIFYVEGKNYYHRDAAENIADGCKTEEDVLEKKANFNARLRNKGILEFPFANRYDEALTGYNLEGNKDLNSILDKEISEKDIEKGAVRVSDIYKLRNGKHYKNFEEIKYLFVSDNSKVHYVNNYYKKQFDCYDFVMRSSKLTNILWIKMNKGLSNAPLPSSLRAITRSRVVISGITSAKMKTETEIVKSKIEAGELDKEALYEMISEFKNYAKHPDDITSESIDLNLQYIQSEMKSYGEELSLYKSEVEKEKGKRGDVTEAFRKYTEMDEERQRLLDELETKKGELATIKKRNGYEKIICYVKRFVAIFVCFVIIWGILCIVNKENYVEWMSKREWAVSMIFTIISVFVRLVLKRNRISNFAKKEELISKFIYGRLDASNEKLSKCENEIEKINNEISVINNKMKECKLKMEE